MCIPLKGCLELNLFQLATLITLLWYMRCYQPVPFIPGSHGEVQRVAWNINASVVPTHPSAVWDQMDTVGSHGEITASILFSWSEPHEQWVLSKLGVKLGDYHDILEQNVSPSFWKLGLRWSSLWRTAQSSHPAARKDAVEKEKTFLGLF